MSVQWRVMVREGSNEGPLVVGAIVQVEGSGVMDGNGHETVSVLYLTVTAPGFEPYLRQPYQIESLAGFIPIALKRAAAPVPVPVPPPVPAPAPAPYHVPAGLPLTAFTAQRVVSACEREFSKLLGVFHTDEEAVAACQEFLLRVIWHLQLAGFGAARQRNPSGILSNDKLCIDIKGWHTYDIMSMGYADRATTIQFSEVWPPNPVPDSGIPD